ncbi:Glutathione S-transferase F10 [Platanthera guangdongensis]|uniref:glutathione transferase n=1 Tax=Platanthera guangdongensis TaxID=2320717 RepID=A0ABR2LMC1_9ASPA
MAAVTVYGPPLSTAVARVLACLFEKEVSFQLAAVDMAKGQHKSPDFLKLQGLVWQAGGISAEITAPPDRHRVSCVRLISAEISDESRAISRYICDKYADQGYKALFGNSILERARIDQWLEAESQNFNPPSSVLVFQLAFAPRMGLKQDPEAIKENVGKLAKVVDVYERRLEESRFLAGDEFSLADLTHLPNGQFLANAAESAHLFTTGTNVARWWGEISSRPSWKKVIEAQLAPVPS